MFSSITGKISSVFKTKEKTTGEKFIASLKDPKKVKISMMNVSLQKAMEAFDVMSNRHALLIYYEPSDSVPLPFEIYLLQNFASDIEKDFAFIGVNGSSSEVPLIKNYIANLKKPSLLSFFFDSLGQITTAGFMEIDEKIVKMKTQIKEFLKTAAEVSQGAEEEYKKNLQSFKRKAGGHDDNEYFPEEQQNEDMDFERLQMQRQMSADRHTKTAQDMAYEETLKNIEREKQKKALEEKTRREEEEKRQRMEMETMNLKQRFDQEVVDPKFMIELLFRFPNGQRMARAFDRRSPIKYAMLYAGTIEDKGFEEANSSLLLSGGYPPKTFDPEATLEHYFGDNENEMVHVKECFN